MKILGFNVAHDSSACIIEDGKLIFYAKEEAFSGTKRDSQPSYVLDFLKNSHPYGSIDLVAYSSPTIEPGKMNPYITYAKKFFTENVNDFTQNHHLCHAAHAFYDSGFNESYCVVIDAMGSIFLDDDVGMFLGREHETIFEASYPAKFTYIHGNLPSWYGITLVYALISELIGVGQLENGKTMGLSAYGQIDKNLPPFFKKQHPFGKRFSSIPMTPGDFLYGHTNRNLLNNQKIKEFHDLRVNHEMYNDVKFIFENHLKDIDVIKKVTKTNYQEYANLAAKVQKESEDAVINMILEQCDFKACKNITLSGGYALNCLNNYRLAQELPPEVNLFIEPNADDAGVAIGAAKYLYHKKTKSTDKFPLTNIYNAGSKVDYNELQYYVETQVG